MLFEILSGLLVVLALVAYVVIHFSIVRARRGKELVWSQINCPRCHIPFGAAAAKAATESGMLDGDDLRHMEIRCPGCCRFFSMWGDDETPSESFRYIGVDRLFHTPATELDAFGALKVHFDFQMNVTREDLEARLRAINPKLLERIEFVDSETGNDQEPG